MIRERKMDIIKDSYNKLMKLGINDNNDWILMASRNSLNRYSKDIEIIKNKIDPGTSVLDCGAAPFVLPLALDKLGYKISCIDINPERYKNLNKLPFEVKKCDVDKEEFPYADESFDLIIFGHIFEHLRGNLIFTFSEVKRILKKEGVLIISTPNLKSIKGIFNFMLKDKAYSCAGSIYHEWSKIERLGHMGHVREYTAPEVRDFFRNLGFEFDEIIYKGEFKGGLKSNFYNLVSKLIPKYKPNFMIIFKK